MKRRAAEGQRPHQCGGGATSPSLRRGLRESEARGEDSLPPIMFGRSRPHSRCPAVDILTGPRPAVPSEACAADEEEALDTITTITLASPAPLPHRHHPVQLRPNAPAPRTRESPRFPPETQVSEVDATGSLSQVLLELTGAWRRGGGNGAAMLRRARHTALANAIAALRVRRRNLQSGHHLEAAGGCARAAGTPRITLALRELIGVALVPSTLRVRAHRSHGCSRVFMALPTLAHAAVGALRPRSPVGVPLG